MSVRTPKHPLRPVLPADVARLQDLFAQSIEELTQEDYDQAQRLAWIGRASNADAFRERLLSNLTLVVESSGELIGFASLKDNSVVDLLYVHPHAAGTGVGTTLVDALERIAAGRGSREIKVDASETAVEFFETLGYVAQRRNSINIDDQWLTNTTMTKQIAAPATGTLGPH